MAREDESLNDILETARSTLVKTYDGIVESVADRLSHAVLSVKSSINAKASSYGQHIYLQQRFGDDIDHLPVCHELQHVLSISATLSFLNKALQKGIHIDLERFNVVLDAFIDAQLRYALDVPESVWISAGHPIDQYHINQTLDSFVEETIHERRVSSRLVDMDEVLRYFFEDEDRFLEILNQLELNLINQ